MKNHQSQQLFNSMTDIDAHFIEEAQTKLHRKKSRPFVRWGALAACLCLIVGGALLWNGRTEPPVDNGGPVTVPEGGVAIPPREIVAPDGASETMIVEFFIYQGHCYEQYGFVDMDESLVGEYLGTSTGTIDEWTDRDEYVELSGSVQGDFYSVNGYDPAFMLCMKRGEKIELFICNSGITLHDGSDLYEDRLHLAEKYCSVTYESQDSWYNSKGKLRPLDSAWNQALTDFINALNVAELIPRQEVPYDRDKDAEAVSVFDSCLYHLYFTMEDGVTVHLRLIEGGYVFFDGILDVAARIPVEAFEPLIQQLDAQ